MKRGRKPKSEIIKLASGTNRPDRVTEQIISPLEGEVEKPEWFDADVSEIWDKKVKVYNLRGQKVVGLESALTQYVLLEAFLIKRWKEGGDPPGVNRINAYRIWANEFYDTPASQILKVGNRKDNPFLKYKKTIY